MSAENTADNKEKRRRRRRPAGEKEEEAELEVDEAGGRDDDDNLPVVVSRQVKGVPHQAVAIPRKSSKPAM